MAGELITIEKDGKTAICERFQLAAMEAKGWKVAPKPDGAASPAINVDPKPGLFSIFKGDRFGWADQKTFEVLEKQGWQKAAAGHRSLLLSGDNAPEAIVPLEGTEKGMGAVQVDDGTSIPDYPLDAADEAEIAASELLNLLSGLDPDDDALWNRNGSLKLGPFNEVFGRSETRATVNAVWPEFTRDKLREEQRDAQATDETE